MLYYGRASHTDRWFAQLGYRLPYRINVADFILDIASNDVSTSERYNPGTDWSPFTVTCTLTRATVPGTGSHSS